MGKRVNNWVPIIFFNDTFQSGQGFDFLVLIVPKQSMLGEKHSRKIHFFELLDLSGSFLF